MIEMERMGEWGGSSHLASMIGQTRRRNRSLRGITANSRRPNIITELPSRNQLGNNYCCSVIIPLHKACSLTELSRRLDQMTMNSHGVVRPCSTVLVQKIR